MALVERYRDAQKREDRRAGGIIAMLYNANRSEGAEGLDWQDIFSEWKEETPEQSEEQMLEIMRTWTLATQRIGEA